MTAGTTLGVREGRRAHDDKAHLGPAGGPLGSSGTYPSGANVVLTPRASCMLYGRALDIRNCCIRNPDSGGQWNSNCGSAMGIATALIR